MNLYVNNTFNLKLTRPSYIPIILRKSSFPSHLIDLNIIVFFYPIYMDSISVGRGVRTPGDVRKWWPHCGRRINKARL